MHYLTSNFNLMESNSHWNKLKKKQIIIDKNYNGLIISLKKGNLKNYNFFHLICYVDYSNLNEAFGQIKDLIKLAKDNPKKYFFLYLFVNFHENPIQKKSFNNKFLKINFDLENFYLKTFDQNIAKLFSERNRIHIRFPFDLKFNDFISKEISNNVIYFSSKPYKLIIVDCDNLDVTDAEIFVDDLMKKNGGRRIESQEERLPILKENVPEQVSGELDLQSLVGKVIEGKVDDWRKKALKMRKVEL